MPVTQVITYSLRNGQKCSCSFYAYLGSFTDEVVACGEQQVGVLVDAYLAFLRESGGETPRTRPEYLFELLVLGVLWRNYGNDVLELNGATGRWFARLADLRERNRWLKKAADLVRGLFTARLRSSRSHAPIQLPLTSVDQLARLVRWLEAAGRFAQEARRLRGWETFLEGLPAEQGRAHLPAVMTYASWFEVYSLEALGRYTPNVEQFLAFVRPGYRWREDFLLCGRQRMEYHLNMVGTEILNRALRADFLGAPRKALLAPPCMRARPDDGPVELRCKAIATRLGARCMACTPGCRVYQLTKLGEKHHFAVFILPDDLRVFSRGSFPAEGNEQTGIVGVSCVLTNVQGGWDVRDLGIPAQGLLLDYCGCRYHWHKEGLPTDIDFHQVLQIMGLDQRDGGE